jgi:hypothetical protein
MTSSGKGKPDIMIQFIKGFVFDVQPKTATEEVENL